MDEKKVAQFREKLKGNGVIGPFSKTSDPGIIEAMGYGGLDFVILDLEHGPGTVESLQNNVRAAEVAGIVPIVRLADGDFNNVGRALDIGAGGVQMPMIESAADAEKTIEKARFAPEGMRGVCRYVRAANYSAMPKEEYFKKANDAIIVLQIEGEKGLNALDEVLEVPGIDIIFIGPYDLSQSLGITGQVEDPRVTEAMIKIAEKCFAKGVSVGTFTDNMKQAAIWRDKGLRYISMSVDMGIFQNTCREISETFNK